ncbi:MAG: protease inhibitor I42 family protein [Candidatus Saccharibacteria bacterium]
MSKANWIKWIVASTAIVAMLAVLGVFIFTSSYKNPAKILISEDQDNIEIKKDQNFTIILTSNPSTGYSWSIDGIYNKKIIAKVSNEFQPPASNMIGAPGKELWLFKGNSEGSTKLNFIYTRQKGTDTNQLNHKTFNITVK